MLTALLSLAVPFIGEMNIPYCTVAGKTLTLNAFLPAKTSNPTPAMIDIHGGWFVGGEPSTDYPGYLSKKGVAMFSISYRLGEEGGFPQCIRDCRNAVRFVRKNADRFNIDPNRIAVMGGSAGGYLSLMLAMVPENFTDGGPTTELTGVSAKVCGCFSWIPPTDFLRFWGQGPDDVVVAPDGTKTYRHWDDNVPNDARPHLRSLFHGESPETKKGAVLFRRMSPVGHLRKEMPPVLICDGEKDPIVPGLEGKWLYEQLRNVGADATYWMSPGGHEFPSGPGFDKVLDKFIDRIFKLN